MSDPLDENGEIERQQERRTLLTRQSLGAVGGAAVGMMISASVPAIRANYGLGTVLLWGAIIGGVAVSLGQFEKAGAVLTGSENRLLNFLVGFGLPVAILIVILYLL